MFMLLSMLALMLMLRCMLAMSCSLTVYVLILGLHSVLVTYPPDSSGRAVDSKLQLEG